MEAAGPPSPKRCGLKSGASEIDIVREAFSLESSLLPSLPRALRKCVEEARGRRKGRGKRIFARASTPVTDPGTCSTSHTVSVLTPPEKVLAHFTDEETGAQGRGKNLPEIPAKLEPNPAEPDSETSRRSAVLRRLQGRATPALPAPAGRGGAPRLSPQPGRGWRLGGGPLQSWHSRDPGPQPSQSILSLTSSPLSPDLPATLTYDTATPREG